MYLKGTYVLISVIYAIVTRFALEIRVNRLIYMNCIYRTWCSIVRLHQLSKLALNHSQAREPLRM